MVGDKTKKYVIFFLAGFFLNNLAVAQNIPGGGNVVMKCTTIEDFSFIQSKYCDVKSSSKENEDFSEAVRISTLVQPVYPWDVSIRYMNFNHDFASGDNILLSFWARTISTNQESGDALATFVLEEKETWDKALYYSQSLTKEWRQYFIPFAMKRDIKSNRASFSINTGYKEQVIEIARVQMINFGKTFCLNDLPITKLKYKGMEPDADWRRQALERIEKIRKGELEFRVVDDKGKPLKGAKIEIEQISHKFRFGSAVNAKEYLSNAIYREKFHELFNHAVFENDLKMNSWRYTVNQHPTLEAMALLNKSNISVRGHVLLWPGKKYLPDEYIENANDKKKLNQLVENHIADISSKTNGKLIEWDVVNEANTNTFLQEKTGSEEILYNTFRAARKHNPETKLFVNEYGIISHGGYNGIKQDWYYNYIQRVDSATNGLVDGIGLQCHIATNMTPPEQVIKIIDRFSKLKKDIVITEFTHEVNDEELQAAYTRDFLIATFSHPAVDAILLWGFWEGQIFKPNASLVRKDWSFKPNGLAYKNLVFKEWITEEDGFTNKSGTYNTRGFLGEYEFEVNYKGKTRKGTFLIEQITEKKVIEITF